ncbi:MAG TPA: anthranilate phosphoribosyltransferase [Gaiellaceae bacterium]
MIESALAQLLDGKDLTRAESRRVMDTIMTGGATSAQIGGFLVALRLKGETPDEIAGAAEAMRDHVIAVHPERDDLVDTAGTGGDGGRTFNISTAAALVAAAAGAGVAKHGNRSISSQSGSADVLEELGFNLELPADAIARSIDELGFGFMFAPAHHPAMGHAAPVRRELATRTVFNVLGPLTNPAGARSQVVGVYDAALVPVIADVLVQLGARRAFVVHGAGGIDELSPAGPNLVCEVADGEVRRREIDPLDLGVPRCAPEELRGGTPVENARRIRAVFAGGGDTAARSAIAINAAGAIAAAGHADDLRDGLEAAHEALDSGTAATRLEALAAFSQQKAAT